MAACHLSFLWLEWVMEHNPTPWFGDQTFMGKGNPQDSSAKMTITNLICSESEYHFTFYALYFLQFSFLNLVCKKTTSSSGSLLI
jgi:hypothetical protein